MGPFTDYCSCFKLMMMILIRVALLLLLLVVVVIVSVSAFDTSVLIVFINIPIFAIFCTFIDSLILLLLLLS